MKLKKNIFTSILLLIFTQSVHSYSGEIEKAKVNVNGLYKTSTNASRHQPKLPVEFCADKSIPQSIINTFKASIETWNTAISTYLVEKKKIELFRYNCNKTNKTTSNQLTWKLKDFEKSGDSLAIARTLTEYEEDTGKILKSEILLNAQKYDFKQLKIDLKSVLIHELGHVLGLQHFPISATSVMHQYPFQSGVIRHELADYELETVANFYFPKNTIQSKYLEFFQHYFDGNFQLAINFLKQLSDRDSESYYREGQLYRLIAKTSKLKTPYLNQAETAFKLADQKNNNNYFSKFQLGITYSELGKEEDAKNEFNKVLEKNPNFYEAHAELGSYYFQRIQKNNLHKKAAINHLQRTIEINPVHYLACYLLFEITNESKYKNCYKLHAPKDLLTE